MTVRLRDDPDSPGTRARLLESELHSAIVTSTVLASHDDIFPPLYSSVRGVLTPSQSRSTRPRRSPPIRPRLHHPSKNQSALRSPVITIVEPAGIVTCDAAVKSGTHRS